jgi:putative membrane protein insertion efficiency factor
MKKILLALLRIYKSTLSLLLKTLFSGGCRFSPTCSDYAYQAVGEYGIIKGTALAIQRVARCHPFSEGGYDPVPEQ